MNNGDFVHDMMHKEIEVYVDDMIAKSQGEDDHVVNLRKQIGRASCRERV